MHSQFNVHQIVKVRGRFIFRFIGIPSTTLFHGPCKFARIGSFSTTRNLYVARDIVSDVLVSNLMQLVE